MNQDVSPVVSVRSREAGSSAAFTRRQREAALNQQVEMYTSWARELLDPTPAVIDSPVIRERKVEAARAVLDVLWSVLAERDVEDGEPIPLPGLIWRHFPQDRRLARRVG